MNTRQKTILKSWRQLLRGFAKREWFSLFMSSSLGVFAAETVHLLWLDHSFQSFLLSKYEPSVSVDDPRYYVPYLTLVLLLLFLAVGAFVVGSIWRGRKSWWAGVTSGLVLLSFASAFLISMLPSLRFQQRFAYGCGLAAVWFLTGFVLYLIGRIAVERTVGEAELKVPPSVRSIAGSQLDESGDPIQSWPQDALGRARSSGYG